MNGSWREEKTEGDKKKENGWLVSKYLTELYQLLILFVLKYICDDEWKTKISCKKIQPTCKWKCVEDAKIKTELTESTK